MWKATETVNWPLQVFKQYPALQAIKILINMRPKDFATSSPVFKEVKSRLDALDEADRACLLSCVVIEMMEGDSPEDIDASLKAWQEELGFTLAYDDTIGD